MKTRVRRIINEARVQRTIDPKIWASMSSMSSRLRSTLAQEAKPMKRDTKDVLLQKYVAGLLTMKVDCTNNIQDIRKNKAYQNIGNAFIEAGGTIQEIQKLYQENGGVLNTTSYNDSDDSDNDIIDNDIIDDEPETNDYPEYDEVPDTDTQNNFDDSILKYKEKPEINDYPEYDEVEPEVKPEVKQEQDYPAYDEVETNDEEINQENDYPDYDEVEDKGMTFTEKIEDDMDMDDYFNTLHDTLLKSDAGMYLIWDDYDGLVVSENDQNSIGECIGRPYNFLDKKARFILAVSDEEISLDNPGNNSEYDDYYYNVSNQAGRKRLKVIPGSNYYPQEEKKGDLYTNILINNGNGPAKYVKSLDTLDFIENTDMTNEQGLEMIKQFQKRAYLPTLPELAKAIEFLEPGRYWTSSIIDNGTKNIILQVQPDKVIITDNPRDKAKVVTFIKF